VEVPLKLKLGCSGYQYLFKMDNQKSDEDITIEKNGSKILIDKMSIPFLDEATIDYKESLIKSAFMVIDNPKAELSCSCGSSFAPKLEKKK
jgi:iron-sulfur cluster assembly accessory protein